MDDPTSTQDPETALAPQGEAERALPAPSEAKPPSPTSTPSKESVASLLNTSMPSIGGFEPRGATSRKSGKRSRRKAGGGDSADPAPKELARSDGGRGGSLVLTDLGIKPTKGAGTIAALEAFTSRENLLEGLAAAPDKSLEVEALTRSLREKPNASLAELTVKSGAAVAEVLLAYTKGLAFLRKNEALLEAYALLPALVRDIMKHALDEVVSCTECEGTGRRKRRVPLKDTYEVVSCGRCAGQGHARTSSEHKEWAAKTALELTKMLDKEKGGVNVNVGVNVAAPSGDFMTKVMNTSDAILKAAKVIDVVGTPAPEVPGAKRHVPS